MNKHVALLVMTLLLVACGGEATLLPPVTVPPQPTETPPPAPTAPPIAPTETSAPSPLPTAEPVAVIQDIAYIPEGDLLHKLDLYLPNDQQGPFPTILMIHSGGGDKRNMASLARHFTLLHYAVVSINHRYMPDDIYPAPVEDAFCALAWIYSNAATYDLDPERVAGLGHSFGATLVTALAVVDDSAPFLESCPQSLPPGQQLQVVIPFSGVFDYAAAIEASDNLRDYVYEYLGGSLEQIPEVWAEASPATWVDGSEPPFLLIHGTQDRSIAANNSEDFAVILEQAGVEVELLIIPEADHATVVKNAQAIAAVETFLSEHLE